jgi:hypothetical protein
MNHTRAAPKYTSLFWEEAAPNNEKGHRGDFSVLSLHIAFHNTQQPRHKISPYFKSVECACKGRGAVFSVEVVCDLH